MFVSLYGRPNGLIKPFSSLQPSSSDIRLQQAPKSQKFSITSCGLSSDIGLEQSPSSTTVSYLITSCGLPSDRAQSLSEKFSIKSLERSDAVLELLRDYGFTSSHISRIVSARPEVLTACPKNTLMPKLEFFTSIGVARPALAHILSSNPGVLFRSLERYTIPHYNFLKSFLLSNDLVVRVFLRAPRSFSSASRANIACNVAVLRERGVPECWIVSFFVLSSYTMGLPSAKFAASVNRVAESGFSATKYKFLAALAVFATMSHSTLQRKKEIYERYGWSETEVSAAFHRYPLCLSLSEKKIMENMDFLVNQVGMEPAAVARATKIIGLSLQKRLKPRFSVIQFLCGKGIMKRTSGWPTLFSLSEEKFMQRFIVDNLKDVPRLLEFYQGKCTIEDIDST